MNVATDSSIDVESLPEYQALLVAAAGKPERSMGDSVIEAEPPAWNEVRKLAKELLTDPPHVSILVHLAKAEANINSFIGLHSSLVTIKEKLTASWDAVQPLADEDDPDDPYYERINLMHELSVDPDFLDSLARATIVEVRGLGQFSSRDISIARGQINGTDEEVARCQDGLIRGAFEETPLEDLQTMANAIAEIPGLCRELEALFAERAGTDNLLSLSGLSDKAGEVQDQLLEMAGGRLAAPEVTEEEAAVGGDGAPTRRAVSGNLNSRDRVCRAFDRIIEYYLEHEPSSPVPVLAVRARDMVPKPFFQVLQELAPQHQSDFPALLEAVLGNPLSYLIQDSYRMFMSGELIVTPVSEKPDVPELPPTPPVAAPEPPPEPAAAPEPSVVEVPTEVTSVEQDLPSADPVESDETQPANTASDETRANSEAPHEIPPNEVQTVGSHSDDLAATVEASTPDTAAVVSSIEEEKPVPVPDDSNLSQTASRDSELASVDSRAEVLDVLADIDVYFSNNEPSSPVPLIVAEMRKLVTKSFSELMGEFANAMAPKEEVVE